MTAIYLWTTSGFDYFDYILKTNFAKLVFHLVLGYQQDTSFIVSNFVIYLKFLNISTVY